MEKLPESLSSSELKFLSETLEKMYDEWVMYSVSDEAFINPEYRQSVVLMVQQLRQLLQRMKDEMDEISELIK